MQARWMLSTAAAVSMLGVVAFGTTACHSGRGRGPAERAGAKVDRAADKTGDVVEDAGHKTGHAIERTGEKVNRALPGD